MTALRPHERAFLRAGNVLIRESARYPYILVWLCVPDSPGTGDIRECG